MCRLLFRIHIEVPRALLNFMLKNKVHLNSLIENNRKMGAFSGLNPQNSLLSLKFYQFLLADFCPKYAIVFIMVFGVMQFNLISIIIFAERCFYCPSAFWTRERVHYCLAQSSTSDLMPFF
jgi:hypothetical protein